jgi:uncharacterized protein YbcI
VRCEIWASRVRSVFPSPLYIGLARIRLRTGFRVVAGLFVVVESAAVTDLAPQHTSTGPSERREALRGGSLLAEISNSIVHIYKEFWGKGPTRARTIYAEDLVVTRLEQIFTRAEATLVERGREEEVRNMRRAFQRELEEEFVGAVERLTGRRVTAFISETHAATNMGIELFVLERAEPPADPSADKARDGE